MQEYKGYTIQADGYFSMYTIRPVGRGSIPKELRGRYTSYLAAQKQIDSYLNTKGKGNKDGTADGSR